LVRNYLPALIASHLCACECVCVRFACA
jgi:hypothetical protein